MRSKITIAGAGKVGSTTALMAAMAELGDIVLWNRTGGIAKGLALDIAESAPNKDFDVSVLGTSDFRKTRNSDVIVITAGVPRKDGMDRKDLLKTNAKIIESLIKNLAPLSPNAKLIIVTNPLDAMVYLTHKVSGFRRNRVIGMAGILDSARFKSFIASELNVSVEDVSAFVLGGHGDSMVPLPGHASVNGIPITQLIKKTRIDEIVKRTRNAGAEIIRLEKESSAYYSPAASVVMMIEAILKDKKRVLPCAAHLDGEYGQKGIFMGVPVKLGAEGVEKIYEVKLSKKEKAEFSKSAKSVKEIIKEIPKWQKRK